MTDRLFKFGSFEDELMKGMEKQLSSVQKDRKISKVAKAFDYLSSAAELFDDAGRTKEAEVITKLIEKFAHIDDLIEEELLKQDLSQQMSGLMPLSFKEEHEEIRPLADQLEPELDPLADLLEPTDKKKV